MPNDALMLGVSGLRGTIGGSLTPAVLQRLAVSFVAFLNRSPPRNGRHIRIVFGRDSRPSGYFVRDAAAAALAALGCEVIDLDIVTTPGVAMMVRHLEADGGMVATASHNPIQWNGLKMLNRDGMALSAADAISVIKIFDAQTEPAWVSVQKLLPPSRNTQTHALHIKRILDFVDVNGIAAKRYRVVLDSVNGAGAVPTATLLGKLGCEVVHINATPDGQFPHEPEPTEANLTGLCDEVRRRRAVVGFAQDPDADRLAIVDENGTYIGEEYSFALAARWLLSKRSGVAVTNLSTSRLIDDVAASTNSRVVRTAVGEANVASAMVAHNAVVGGEGNGGVIDPRIVLGRDSLVGIAYILQLMTATGRSISQLVGELPRYTMLKTKFDCRREDADRAVAALSREFSGESIDRQDGIRIDWPDAWVHARPSNTEPIMRLIAEGISAEQARRRIGSLRAVVDRELGRQ
jgi:phosphomannomutase